MCGQSLGKNTCVSASADSTNHVENSIFTRGWESAARNANLLTPSRLVELMKGKGMNMKGKWQRVASVLDFFIPSKGKREVFERF